MINRAHSQGFRSNRKVGHMRYMRHTGAVIRGKRGIFANGRSHEAQGYSWGWQVTPGNVGHTCRQ
jgi:hypothetical protein